MPLNLSLFHLKSKVGFQPPVLPGGYWHFVTCLRSIVISESPETLEILEPYEFYRGREAYRFLLEVICGLHSPMFGETEILGQFKDFVSENKRGFSSEIVCIVDHLLQEARKIRKEYLQNLGCTSYGSLLRKHLRFTDRDIHIIGAGSLSQDILPWLAKSKGMICVYTRDIQSYRFLTKKYGNLVLKTLDCLGETGTGDCSETPLELEKKTKARGILVVAAPLTSGWFNENIRVGSFERIYDLRGESGVDPLCFPNVIPLETLFSNIEKNKREILSVKKSVFQSIKNRTLEVHPQEKQRPFGWEDLWNPGP